jgi:hypothetical protein
MHWNTDGAFLGDLCSEKESQSLLFNTFLAVPLLTTGEPNIERRFTGVTDFDIVAASDDQPGKIIDAYVHYTVIESKKDLLLVDIQGK